MQWHRHDEVGILQDARAGRAHQRSKRAGDRSSTLVLQRMNDLLHAPFIPVNRAGPVDAITGAQPIDDRRRQAERRPAVVADGAVQRMLEWSAASRARRLEERREKLIDQSPPGHRLYLVAR